MITYFFFSAVVCPRLENKPFSYTDISQEYKYDTTLVWTCKIGYHIDNQTTYATYCDKDGLWTNDKLDCKREQLKCLSLTKGLLVN